MNYGYRIVEVTTKYLRKNKYFRYNANKAIHTKTVY
jgi:hypothetical protein